MTSLLKKLPLTKGEKMNITETYKEMLLAKTIMLIINTKSIMNIYALFCNYTVLIVFGDKCFDEKYIIILYI